VCVCLCVCVCVCLSRSLRGDLILRSTYCTVIDGVLVCEVYLEGQMLHRGFNGVHVRGDDFRRGQRGEKYYERRAV